MRTLWPWLMAATLVAACEQSNGPVGPAADGPTFLSTAQRTAESHSIATTITNPCNGEEIALVGVARNTTITVSQPDNTNHTTVDGNIQGTGTGLTSGDAYRFSARFHFSFQTPNLLAPNGTTFTSDDFTAVSMGGDENFFFTFDVHVVVTGTGDVKTTVENFTGECRG